MLIKRIFDIILSFIALLILSPILIILAIIVLIFIGYPFLFCQVRSGKEEKPFKIVKFRTMTDACNAQGELLPDSKRLTNFGQFLRSTSLDELPELWNVLIGEMSLVGPRPLLLEYLPLYSKFQSRRHEVKPGISGWAQVNGRNAISWDEKFNLDVWYVDNQSIWLDIKILFLTLKKISTGDGVTPKDSPIMPVFKGSKK